MQASRTTTAIGCALAAVVLAAASVAVANDSTSALHPFSYSAAEYALLLGVAVLGGMVGWYGRIQTALPLKISAFQIIGEVGTSAFAGLLAFWLAEWAGAPELLSICIVGVAGHMGARFLLTMETWLRRRLNSLN